MEKLLDRFLRYVSVDTQSNEDSETQPSTDKQLDLLRMLRDERGAWCSMSPVYPAGEGVGAAGGIVSAACDGIRAAEAMMKNCR